MSKSEENEVSTLFKGIKNGDIYCLSRSITYCESNLEKHKLIADKLIKKSLPLSGNSIRVGITGIPGVGKSTFIESFANYLIDNYKEKVAVLAIDPSSQKSKGALLGDKTRMAKLNNRKEAFIRPSASGKSLGGVCSNTREAIILCEAAGYKNIIIETVGVGQSETQIKSMTDFFLLLVIAGAGDGLQGIKRGIIEMVDAIAINKADGNNIDISEKSRQEYENALLLMPKHPYNWKKKVAVCSSTENTNINKIDQLIKLHNKKMKKNGFFKANREQQNQDWFSDLFWEEFITKATKNKQISKLFENAKKSVIEGKESPRIAVRRLLNNNSKILNLINV